MSQQPHTANRAFTVVSRALARFTDGLWGPTRQMGMVATMRPDWDSAPVTFIALGWYAALLTTLVAAGLIAESGAISAGILGQQVLQAVHTFLVYSLSQAFYVCVFTAVGRWFVFWNCVARKASPLQLLGMTYAASGIDQVLKLFLDVAVGTDGASHVLLAGKDVAVMALGVMILVDFFRPRTPRSPRRKPRASKPAGFENSTRPAPI